MDLFIVGFMLVFTWPNNALQRTHEERAPLNLVVGRHDRTAGPAICIELNP